MQRTILLVLAALSLFAQPAADRQRVEALIGDYAKSVEGADTVLAARVWSQAADVTMIHPAGHERGFSQVRDNVYGKAMGETFSERKLTVKDVHVVLNGKTAWAEFAWDFVAKLRKGGAPYRSKGRETQIYRKEKSGWRLVHIHYSGVPVTAQ